MYKIFTRNWWREPTAYEASTLGPHLIPDEGASKHTIATVETETEARDYCKTRNDNRPKSWERLSRKFEYTFTTK